MYKFWRKKKAASLTGYGLIVGLIAVVALAAVNNIGGEVKTLFNLTGNAMEAAAGGGDSQTSGSEGGGAAVLSFDSITLLSPSSVVTSSNTLTFQASFSEAVTNVDITDFVVTGTTTTIDSVNDAGGGTAWNIVITDSSPLDGTDGDLGQLDNVSIGLDLAGGQDIQDLSGGNLPAGEPPIDETFTHITTLSLSFQGSISDTDINGAHDVEVVGNVAWVASRDASSVTAIDVSDPTNMSVLGTVSSGTELSSVHRIVISGNVAYLAATGNDAITSIDISDPANPTILDSISSATELSSCFGLDISGNTVFVGALSNNALTTVDVTDPSNMVILDSISDPTLNGVYDVAVSGNVAWLAANNADAVTGVDITDVSNLSMLGSISHANLDGVRAIDISGNVAWVGAFSVDNLLGIDISDPNNPSIITTFSNVAFDGIFEVEIQGSIAYTISYFANRVNAIDISVPATRSIMASYTNSTLLYQANGIGVTPSSVYAVSSGADALSVIDIVP